MPEKETPITSESLSKRTMLWVKRELETNPAGVPDAVREAYLKQSADNVQAEGGTKNQLVEPVSAKKEVVPTEEGAVSELRRTLSEAALSPEVVNEAEQIVRESLEESPVNEEVELTPHEELLVSRFKIKADSKNQLPTNEEVEQYVRNLIEARGRSNVMEVVDNSSRELDVSNYLPIDERIEGEFVDTEYENREPVWYEGMYTDLTEATRGLKVWKDRNDHSKGKFPQDQINADKQLIIAARRSLKDHGVYIDEKYIDNDDYWRQQVGQAKRLVVDGLPLIPGGMTKSEAEEIFKGLNVDVDKVKEEKNALRNKERQQNASVDNGSEKAPSTHKPPAQKFEEDMGSFDLLTDSRDRLAAFKSIQADLIRRKPDGWTQNVQKLREKMDAEVAASPPKKDEFSREVEVKTEEDWMILRGSMIEVVTDAGMNTDVEDVLKAVRQNFLAKKKTTFGVLPPEVEAIAKVEIRSRLELKQASLFWNRMKDDKNPEADTYPAMKSGMSNMPLLSESTYRWLMKDGVNTSYITRNSTTGEIEKHYCENQRRELDIALKKIHDYIVTKDDLETDKSLDGDLWKVMNYDQRVALFKKLAIDNFDIATLAFQLAEAECWTAMRPKSYHPARRLAYLSDYRMERLTSSLSVPGGMRLVQEYQDKHNGALPYRTVVTREGKKLVIDDKGVFDKEGVSLARIGLGMYPEAKSSAANGSYLRTMSDIFDSPDRGVGIRRSQLEMRQDFSFGSAVYDSLELLGKPPVSLDTLGRIKGTLFAWYIQRYPEDKNFFSGVSLLMLEYSKTYLWANSVANNIKNLDASKISDLNKFYYETFVTLVDAFDPTAKKGMYVGIDPVSTKRIVENRNTGTWGDALPIGGNTSVIDRVGGAMSVNQEIDDIVNWFDELLFDKCFPIVESARKDNSFEAKVERLKLPSYLIRSDRNQATMIKIKDESVGFKEKIRVSLRKLSRDRSKWWNRR